MAEKRKPKDLDPKAKGAKVKGGNRSVTEKPGRRKLIQDTLSKVDRTYRRHVDLGD